MVIIIYWRKRFDLDDQYIASSPLLDFMGQDENGVINLIIDIDGLYRRKGPKAMEQYLRYLQGLPFIMDQWVERLFTAMGHGSPESSGSRSLDEWKDWLIDDWHRLENQKHPYHMIED